LNAGEAAGNWGRCPNYGRASPATNGVEIPYDGDRRYNSFAYQRGEYEARGLVPPGYKDDRSKNSCKLSGLQSAIPEGTAVVFRMTGNRYLGFDKKTNLALTFDTYDEETCKMRIHYPIEGDRNVMAFENINGDWFTGGIMAPYDTPFNIFGDNPEGALKVFGLKWHAHFKPRMDPLLTPDDQNRWNLKYRDDYDTSKYVPNINLWDYVKENNAMGYIQRHAPWALDGRKTLLLSEFFGRTQTFAKTNFWDNPTVRFHPHTQYWCWGRWAYPDRGFVINCGLGGWSPACWWGGGPKFCGGAYKCTWLYSPEPGRTGGCPGGCAMDAPTIYVIESETMVPTIVDE
jgi:hypothetical protein